MTWLVHLVCAIAGAYQLVALAAVLRHLRRREAGSGYLPKVSVLKPVHGRDAFFEQAIESHMRIDYPDYEVLFAVDSDSDEAVSAVGGLSRARLFITQEERPNAKAAKLIELSRHAAGEVWVVNDSDIKVTADYLRRVVAPLANPDVGLVTCLYRPVPRGLPAWWEALGIATEFAPSTLVAPLVGINEFGLGSTLCFRAADLRSSGGFEAVADYLADDYQLAKRLTRGRGKRGVISKLVVEHGVEYRNWAGVWNHQVRWARTIRVSRAEYAGLPVTHAGVWALLALLCGFPGIAAALAGVRILMGFTSSVLLLRYRAAWLLPLIPLWDLWAFCVWAAGLRGDVVEWRGRKMKLRRDGKLAGWI